MAESSKKNRSPFYLSAELERQLDECKFLSEATTRQATIENAIKFYYGYLTNSVSQEYLCGTVGTKIEAAIRRSDDHQARLLYKIAVELNLAAKISAGEKGLTKEGYEKLRKKAVQDVNAVKGVIKLYEVSE